MYGRTILIVASLAVAVLSVPIATSSVPAVVDIAIARRNNAPLDIVAELLKREPIIEAIQSTPTLDIFQSRDEAGIQEQEEDNVDELETSETIEERGVRNGGNNPRGVRKGGNNPRGVRHNGHNTRDVRGNGPNSRRSILQRAYDSMFRS